MIEEAKRPSTWALARAFNQIALESFGGGLSAWSREVIVRERGWLSDEEFLSASTICRILPGANQVNMAVFVGTRMRGLPGAFAAITGLLVVPGAVVLVAGALYVRFRDLDTVRHVLSGMASAAAGLTFSVAWAQARKTLVSPASIGLCATTLVLTAFLRVPLWVTVLLCGPAGFAWAWRSRAGR